MAMKGERMGPIRVHPLRVVAHGLDRGFNLAQYQRTLLVDQMDGAARMADADGADLESLLHGWWQPA